MVPGVPLCPAVGDDAPADRVRQAIMGERPVGDLTPWPTLTRDAIYAF